MKWRKRLISAALTVCMAAMLLPTTALANGKFSGYDTQWYHLPTHSSDYQLVKATIYYPDTREPYGYSVFENDDAGRPISQTDYHCFNEDEEYTPSLYVSYSYDTSGNISRSAYYGFDDTTGAVETTPYYDIRYTCDTKGRIAKEEHVDETGIYEWFKYSYDEHNNITQKTHSYETWGIYDVETRENTYDANGNLTKIEYDYGGYDTYTYDFNNRVTKVVSFYTDGSGEEEFDSGEYTYDEHGNEIACLNINNGYYYTYEYEKKDGSNPVDPTPTPTPDPTPTPTPSAFTDVPSGQYYTDAVAWAVEKGITNGTTATTFSPNQQCTRAQIVTFLWRAAGSPEPKTTNCAFTDVQSSDYFYKAVLWAVENDITLGTSATTFSPSQGCSRAQVVTFQWRANGEPQEAASNAFTDVAADEYYTTAVAWAVKNEITNGTTETTFSPKQVCTRGQIVTFLWRDMA